MQVQPNLFFNGRCEEAIEFYRRALGAEVMWMIQVNSKQEAIDWAKRCPASDNEVSEIRQVFEMSDFPEDVQEAVARFREMQAQSGVGKRP